MTDVTNVQAAGVPVSQRTVNARRLLDVIWSGEPLTATELMAATGLTRTTVLSVCRDLVESGWLKKVADARATGDYSKGRPALRHAFRPDAAFVIACDADEDLFTVAVADLHGVERVRLRRNVGQIREPSGRRGMLAHLVDEALQDSGITAERIGAVVVGIPAPVDNEGGSPPPDEAEEYWNLMNPGFATMFQERGWPVMLDNDANLGALCEASDGAGVGIRSFATLLADERFGAGVVVDGRLLRGTRGGVGELRVLDIVTGVEAPHGLARRARWEVRRLAQTGQLTGELAELPAEQRSAEAVFSAAERGDVTALQVVDALAGRLAPVVQLLSGLLDLDRIIIAGALASSAEPVMRRAREILDRDPDQHWAEIVASAHGADVVLRGAVSSAIGLVRQGAMLDREHSHRATHHPRPTAGV